MILENFRVLNQILSVNYLFILIYFRGILLELFKKKGNSRMDLIFCGRISFKDNELVTKINRSILVFIEV